MEILTSKFENVSIRTISLVIGESVACFNCFFFVLVKVVPPTPLSWIRVGEKKRERTSHYVFLGAANLTKIFFFKITREKQKFSDFGKNKKKVLFFALREGRKFTFVRFPACMPGGGGRRKGKCNLFPRTFPFVKSFPFLPSGAGKKDTAAPEEMPPKAKGKERKKVGENCIS